MKPYMPFVLSRRAVLRGAGASVALPVLESMLNTHGTALAAGDPLPRRFMTWFFGNGVVPQYWPPAQTGAAWELGPEQAPLANVKNYVNIVTGYDVKIPRRNTHFSSLAAVFSGADYLGAPGTGTIAKFALPSIDQVVAEKIAGQTLFPSVQVGVYPKVNTAEGPAAAHISHKSTDAPLPSEFNPQKVFDRLFGSFTPPAVADPTAVVDPTPNVRRSVLDLVRADATRLTQRLGAADRQRLDAHLTGIAQLQKLVAATPPVGTAACTKPGRPVIGSGAAMLEVNKVMSDLVAHAFSCDLTRVVSFQFTGEVSNWTLPAIGLNTNHHVATHNSEQQEVIHRSVIWTMERFAYLVEKLMSIPEGTGNLLDNAVIVASSGVAWGFQHRAKNMPFLVVGGGGGTLKKPGVHHKGTAGNTSDVILAALQAAGTGLTSFGKDEAHSANPCREIMV